MKLLILVRHAKSSWEDLSLSDFDRPLNDRGKKDGPKMARRFKERNITPDLLYSSPAKRALKTCKIFAETLKLPNSIIRTDEGLYHADAEKLLGLCRKLKDKQNVVLVFGHNPGLTEFTNLIAGENLLNIPTCGIAAVRFRVKNWKDISPAKGKLEFFDFPKKNKRKE